MGVPLLHYRSTRYLGGADRCHATNLHEVGDSRDVCHVITFMGARPVTWQINEGVAPYPSCLYPGSFARASTKGKRFHLELNNNNNNINNDNNNNNNNNNRSRASADLLGMYVIKLF